MPDLRRRPQYQQSRGGRGRPGKSAQPASSPAASGPPDVRRYAAEMQDMLRQRDPQAYRAFIRKWRDLHQRGAADQLLKQDDAALRLRIEHMILSTPALADLHEAARAYLAEHEAPTPPPASRAWRRW